MIHLTANAITQLRAMLAERNATPGTGLRLEIEKGGCAGMQYAMRLDVPSSTDQIFGTDGITVIVGSDSLSLLNGSTLDFVDSLNDSGFKIENPQAARSCGCGTSFEPKADA